MSIPYSGALKRSAGVISAINKQLRQLTLKPAKKIVVKFDPFHERVKSIREFMYHISSQKVLSTNLSCTIKPEVFSDRIEPAIDILLVDGGRVVLKTANLTTLELLQLYNKHITPLAPVEEVVPEIKTKSSRTASAKRR